MLVDFGVRALLEHPVQAIFQVKRSCCFYYRHLENRIHRPFLFHNHNKFISSVTTTKKHTFLFV